MNILRYLKLLKPSLLNFHILSILCPARVWEVNQTKAAMSGLSRSVFILSFDCDTELDIRTVEGVHNRLLSKGIHPIYAVPGELLVQGSKVYKRIHDSGAEFINHGYKRHSEVSMPDRKYIGTFFYENSSRNEIIEDIELGHKTIHDVLGVEATTFRTPHFGGFYKKSQLGFLWDLLKKMNYFVSTSTTPYFGYTNGPISLHAGIWEIPISGDPNKPSQILDSWSYAFSGKESLSKNDFIQAIESYGRAMRRGEKVFLNIYADPSQVHDWPEFFESVASLAQFNSRSFLEAKLSFQG